MAYVLKLISAKSLRFITSFIVKQKTPPQSTPQPKPALTIHLDRLGQQQQQQRRQRQLQRQSPIQVDVYLPSANTSSTDTALPVVVNMHGSGFLLETFGDDAKFCQLIADEVNCAVFDMDYSKAPEYPFPCANEDAENVIEWIRQGDELEKKLKVKGIKVKSDGIALTGFSSGGNLVLTTCVRAKNSGKLEMIKAVVAFYPSTNLAESPYEKPAMKPDAGQAGAVMPPFMRQFLYSCYVPLTQQVPRSAPIISPLNASADAFPSSVTIITCQGDSLAREGQQLALKIRKGRSQEGKSNQTKTVLNETVSSDVLWWEAKGQGHAWDKMCKDESEAAKMRDYAYTLTAERLKAALS